MASKFLALPTELRIKIYEFTFSPDDIELVKLLSCTKPDLALRATCRFMHNETAKTYGQACIRYTILRAEALTVVTEEAVDLVAPHSGLNVRELGLNTAVGLLTAEMPWGESFRCSHSCQSENAYACTCREHKTCFKCGGWLALAVYYDLHPEAKTLRLISSGGLTRLGGIVGTHTKSLQVGTTCGVCGQVTERYPPLERAFEFGETWWRFELERQRMLYFGIRLQKEAEEKLGKRDSSGASLPAPGVSDSEVTRWNQELQKVEQWQSILFRNGLSRVNWGYEWVNVMLEVESLKWKQESQVEAKQETVDEDQESPAEKQETMGGHQDGIGTEYKGKCTKRNWLAKQVKWRER